MAEITGGELLVKCLANEGIRFVFGLPCPEVDPMIAKLDQSGVRFVPVRHEAPGVHMAAVTRATATGPARRRARFEQGRPKGSRPAAGFVSAVVADNVRDRVPCQTTSRYIARRRTVANCIRRMIRNQSARV